MAKIVEQIVNLKAIKQKLDQISAGTVSIIDNLTSWGSDKALSAEQGKALKDLVDTANREIAAIKRILQSSDVNLDTIEEIITKIKAMDNALWGISTVIETKKNELLGTMRGELNQKVQELTNLINTKASQADIVDNLTSDATKKALSAKQGKVLKGLINSVTTTGIAKSNNLSDLPDKATARTNLDVYSKGEVDTKLNTKQNTSEKNKANGYAGLDSNKKLDPSVLPTTATTEVVTVSNKAARLALTATQIQKWDFVVQTDTGERYMFSGTNPATEGDWTLISTVLNLKFRTGDKTQFDAIATKDASTIYFVKE